MLHGYLLDLKKLPREQIKYIGVEKLTTNQVRDVFPPAASREQNEDS